LAGAHVLDHGADKSMAVMLQGVLRDLNAGVNCGRTAEKVPAPIAGKSVDMHYQDVGVSHNAEDDSTTE
jgi:hypothetical protein